MSFQIRFNPASRVVSTVFFGRVEFAEKIASARQLAEKYGHLHPFLLLVDVRRADVVLSIEERQQFGVFVAHLQGLNHARVAVLHAPDSNANLVIGRTAQAEGMQAVEFVTEPAALHWLTEGDGISGAAP